MQSPLGATLNPLEWQRALDARPPVPARVVRGGSNGLDETHRLEPVEPKAVGLETPSNWIAWLVVTRPLRFRCSTNRSEPGGSAARILAESGSARNVTRSEAVVWTNTGSGRLALIAAPLKN